MTSNSRKVRPKPSGDDSGDNTSITGQHSSLIVDNVDMIAQILVRLPVKYLLRSKSVSKTWLSVVTAPSFVRNYSVRNRRSVSGLFLKQYSDVFEGKYEFIPLDKQNGTRRIEKGKGRKGTRNNNNNTDVISFKTLNFLNVHGRIKIEQSCNGLLCCSHSVKNSRHKPEVAAYYIYNPSTKSYKIVPESPFRQDGCGSVHSMSLAFDPLKSPYYEVICFLSDNKEKDQMEIYSSKTSSWRLCKAPFETKRNEFGFSNFGMYKSGVFWNGSRHWESVYFDIDQELLKEMPELPNAADYNDTDKDEDEDDSYTDDNDEDSHGDSDDDDTEDSMSVS
ncbi:F-box protein At5g07610-like [Papaver somniferum]|uniref:F-box protein At5g07610-like n=1 Tax=Papaver somniferum TaxID=3469 RepID=UPI000E6F6D68|nr:F-box protein At5g07610-like [Papaver somniferum]